MLTPTALRGCCVFCGVAVAGTERSFLGHLDEHRWCRDRYFEAWLGGLTEAPA